jgi:prepilin-type N-terminal cleavage/methylation domain-containing protein
MVKLAWKNKAFTLLELVITIAIISIGMVFVIQALGFTAKASAVYKNYLRASLLGEDNIQNLEFRESQKLLTEGNFDDKKDIFDISLVVNPDEQFNLYRAALKISWPASKRTEGLKLSIYYRK